MARIRTRDDHAKKTLGVCGSLPLREKPFGFCSNPDLTETVSGKPNTA